MNVYTFYVWIDVIGVKFIKGYCVESLQVYSQFFNTVFACVILKMIQSRYKYQKFLLNPHLTLARKQLSNLILLKVKRNLLVLKETVDHFNDIFGWAILLNIFFASLRGLIYLDDTIKGVDNIKNVSRNYWQIASQIFFVLIFWVSLADFETPVSRFFLQIGIFALILWCDTIRKEFEELLSYCYQMQTRIAESTFTENDMCIFTKSVSQSMPEFTAARYFSIDRSTIFSILNSITTFLLVMIQFKSL
jgi:gustatory receptor